MEMNTQTKWFILLLAPCLALFICQLPSYLLTLSEPWEEVLPAPPANSVMIVGVSSKTPFPSPNFVITKENEYYQLIGKTNNQNWISVENNEKKSYNNLLESDQKFSHPLIPFLFNRPPCTVIDHFYTEHLQIHPYPPSGYRVYYVLLDGGTLWSWSEPLLVENHKALNRFGVIYAMIVFGVTGIMLLVIKRVGRPLPFRKPHQLLLLIFLCLTIGFFIAIPACYFYIYVDCTHFGNCEILNN